MSFYYSDEPERDAEMYYNDLEKRKEKLPKCCECGEPIQDECCYEFDGYIYCPKCVSENHIKWVNVMEV